MPQASSFLITIIDIYFKNINHSPFSLHTFSIAEKVCNPDVSGLDNTSTGSVNEATPGQRSRLANAFGV